MLNPPGSGRNGRQRAVSTTATDTRLVVFVLDEQRYALPLETVDRVVRAVAVTSLPDAPDIILGVINLQGRVVPVIDLRRRFRLPERPLDVDDHLIVAESATGPVALPVDEAEGLVRDLNGEAVPAADIVPNLNYVDQVFLYGSEMVFVLDIETVLTEDEELALAESLRGVDGPDD
jgi:purine-binding chemotaxis protein CheW